MMTDKQEINNLIKNTILYSIGPLLNRIIALSLLPIYSFVLSKNEFGYFDLLTVSVPLIISIITYKIADGVYLWLLENKNNLQQQKTSITNGFVVLGIVILFLIISVVVIPASNHLPSHYLTLGFIISLIIYLQLQQILRGLSFVKVYTCLAILNSLFIIVFTAIFIFNWQNKIAAILTSLTLANFLSILIIAFYIKINRWIDAAALDWKKIKQMLAYSGPLVLNAVAWWSMSGFERYIINYHLGIEINAEYAIPIKYASLLLLLNSFFLPAWQDFLLTKNDEGKTVSKNRYLNEYLVFQFTAVICISCLAPFVFNAFFENNYHKSWIYAPLLLLSTAFFGLSSFLGAYLVAQKNSRQLFSTTVWGSIINIAITLLLINQLRLYAICIGQLTGYVVTFCIRYFQLKNKMNLQINLPVLALLISFFIAFYIGLQYASTVFLILLFLCSCGLAIIFNKQLLLEILRFTRFYRKK